MTGLRWAPDRLRLDHLAQFARIEVESRDVEPWALVIGEVHAAAPDVEATHWLINGYNAFDTLDSAWRVAERWPTPAAWLEAPDRGAIADLALFPIFKERRNLYGGRVIKRYLDHASRVLDGQDRWLRAALAGHPTPGDGFAAINRRVREVWGVGRQAGFEWAEFLAKALDYPIHAPNAYLWESEGPRRCLQRLYGEPTPDRQWLEAAAWETRDMLSEAGVRLSWEDFETIICDFNVMRDGRYYPGNHLAALAEELTVAGSDHLWMAWHRAIPAGWADIKPGIDKRKQTLYMTDAIILDRP